MLKCIFNRSKNAELSSIKSTQVKHQVDFLSLDFGKKNPPDYYRESFVTLPLNTYTGEIDLPDWLSLAKTTLTPKIENTRIAKNYRPIACLNIMYKIYTSCLNIFLE